MRSLVGLEVVIVSNVDQPIGPFAVSPAQAARLLSIGRTLLYELIGSGELRTIKVHNRRLVPVSEIQALIQVRMAAESGPDRPQASLTNLRSSKVSKRQCLGR